MLVSSLPHDEAPAPRTACPGVQPCPRPAASSLRPRLGPGAGAHRAPAPVPGVGWQHPRDVSGPSARTRVSPSHLTEQTRATSKGGDGSTRSSAAPGSACCSCCSRSQLQPPLPTSPCLVQRQLLRAQDAVITNRASDSHALCRELPTCESWSTKNSPDRCDGGKLPQSTSQVSQGIALDKDKSSKLHQIRG